MPITGTLSDLSNRAFSFSSPLFAGIKCFYYGGGNKNLLVGRSGTFYNPDKTPTTDADFSYVASSIAGVTGGKAIANAVYKDALILDKPVSANTNDLPGNYTDFTILWYGKIIGGQNSGTVYRFWNKTNNHEIRLSCFAVETSADGTDFNFTIDVKGTANVSHASDGGKKGEFHCYALRQQGTNLRLFVDGVPKVIKTDSSPGTLNLDGYVLFNRSDTVSWEGSLSKNELSLFVVYDRALSDTDLTTLSTSPFSILPDPGASPSPTPTPTPTTFTKTVRNYWVGNSVSDTQRLASLKPLLQANGWDLLWGRSMTPGAPLDWILNNPPAFTESPYGAYSTALGGYDWDVLTLQPFDRSVAADKAAIKTYADLLYGRAGNANTRLLIYSRWPRRSEVSTGVYNPLNYPVLWAANYDANSYAANNYENKDFFQKLLLEVRALYPTKQVDIMPVGDALLLFDTEAKAGNIPGYTNVSGLYADGIHLNDDGAYLVGMVAAATLYKADPKDLGFSGYPGMTQARADKLQAIAWSTVLNHPYSGVTSSTPTPTPSPTPTPQPTPTPTPTITPSPAPSRVAIDSILRAYPGQKKVIQFLNPDLTPYVIPTGATVLGSLVNLMGSKIDTLSPVIDDASKGLVRVTLGTSTAVKRNKYKDTFYNIQLVLPGDIKKNLGVQPMLIVDDLMDAVTTTGNTFTAGTGTGTGGTTNTGTQAPDAVLIVGIEMYNKQANKTYYLQVDGQGKVFTQEVL